MNLVLDTSEVRNIRGIGGACQPVGQARIDLVANGQELKGVTLTVLPGEAMVSEDILKRFTAVVSENDSWLIKID